MWTNIDFYRYFAVKSRWEDKYPLISTWKAFNIQQRKKSQENWQRVGLSIAFGFCTINQVTEALNHLWVLQSLRNMSKSLQSGRGCKMRMLQRFHLLILALWQSEKQTFVRYVSSVLYHFKLYGYDLPTIPRRSLIVNSPVYEYCPHSLSPGLHAHQEAHSDLFFQCKVTNALQRLLWLHLGVLRNTRTASHALNFGTWVASEQGSFNRMGLKKVRNQILKVNAENGLDRSPRS